MIWGLKFPEIEAHLRRLGFRRFGLVDGTVLFRRDEDVFTIREPNVDGLLPEAIVIDAFDKAGIDPPEIGRIYVD